MSTLLTTAKVKTDARAIDVQIDDDSLEVTLSDGRLISAPLVGFPRLRDASQDHSGHWRLIGPGIGIHWEALDEDISVRSLLTSEI